MNFKSRYHHLFTFRFCDIVEGDITSFAHGSEYPVRVAEEVEGCVKFLFAESKVSSGQGTMMV